MMAKHNDCKEQWLQRGMTAKKDDCKKTMTAIKQWLQRTVPCKEQFWKSEVFHESFVFTSLTCRFWRKSRTKASIAQLQLADFEGNSHESFVFTSSTRRFWRTRARKLSFAQLQLADFEGNLARKLRFHQLAAWSGGQNVPCQRPQPCQPTVAQIPVFSTYQIPNSYSFSIAYSITYSYYLIPITCVFAAKVGLLSPCVQKHREKR